MDNKRWTYLNVEPVIFLYMLAFKLTSVVEEAFYVSKACHSNLGFPKNICDNISLSENLDFKKDVQVETALFHQWENIASHAIPAVLALFLGSWSDKVGRKLPLLIGLFGNFIYFIMILVNSLNDNWRLEMILLTACLPCAMTGGNLTVVMAAFSYLADTTSQESRTLRSTLLTAAFVIPMPIGVAIGSYLFDNVFDRSYSIMFTINCVILTVAIFYTWWALDWKTSGGPVVNISDALWGLFDLRHIVESVKTITRPRKESRRAFLFLITLAMALYTFQREEKHMIYLYTQLRFKWDVATFSLFRTTQSVLFVVGLLAGVPIMTKYLKIKDTIVLMVGAMSHSIARIVFASVKLPSLLYLGAVVGLLGPVVAPVLRSMVSKLVPPSETGKVFAIFTIADTAIPLFSGAVYSQLYKATISSLPQSFLFVTIGSQVIVFSISLFIHVKLKGRKIIQAEDTVENFTQEPCLGGK